MTHVSAIMTAHHEGQLAEASIGSFREAINHAGSLSIGVEPIIILDRPNGSTREVFSQACNWGARVIFTDYGDPGLSRNRAIAESSGDFVTFLDADDLWSFNWIALAMQFFLKTEEKIVGHSEVNLVFGDQQAIWVHPDQREPSFDPNYQRVANYWDGLCFTRRQTLIQIPFRENDLPRGYGHEDWDWNNLTMLAGYTHRPVPGTLHMKRKRQHSQMAFCDLRDVVIRPSALQKYDTELRELISVMLDEDSHFIFPRNDSYWITGSTVGRGLYEPEIDWLLQRATDRPYALIDCGANFGYWSILASSNRYGLHQVVAIEAARANYEILKLNLKANNGRFSALHRAVAATSGTQVHLYGRRHFGMSLREDWGPADSSAFEEVETVTVDEIANNYLSNQRHPTLIKIDVEGSEIEAIQGARQQIEQGALFIFEDHGLDQTHAISRYVLGQKNIAVWWITSELRPVAITTIDQVVAIKKNPQIGYNFFAYRTPSAWSSLF